MANPVFSGGNIAGDVLPDVTGRKMGSLTQLWNFFAQKLNYAGATSGQTIVQASAVASGTLTLPAATDTLVGKATTDTLTNKTLTNPVVTNPSTTGTDSGTQTLSNKTLNQPLIVGVTDGSDAAAGKVGEFQSAKQTSAQPLSTGTTINLVSLSLTAGDWDVVGNVAFTGNSATLTGEQVGISNTSLSFLPADGSEDNLAVARVTTLANGFFTLATPVYRVSINTTTTYYLPVNAVFGSGTCSAQGMMRARRVR